MLYPCDAFVSSFFFFSDETVLCLGTNDCFCFGDVSPTLEVLIRFFWECCLLNIDFNDPEKDKKRG